MLRNWAEITSHTCGEASKEDHSVTARPTAPLIIAFITGHPAGRRLADQGRASRPAGSYPGRDRRYRRSVR
jgi:hypothetical protein